MKGLKSLIPTMLAAWYAGSPVSVPSVNAQETVKKSEPALEERVAQPGRILGQPLYLTGANPHNWSTEALENVALSAQDVEYQATGISTYGRTVSFAFPGSIPELDKGYLQIIDPSTGLIFGSRKLNKSGNNYGSFIRVEDGISPANAPEGTEPKFTWGTELYGVVAVQTPDGKGKVYALTKPLQYTANVDSKPLLYNSTDATLGEVIATTDKPAEPPKPQLVAPSIVVVGIRDTSTNSGGNQSPGGNRVFTIRVIGQAGVSYNVQTSHLGLNSSWATRTDVAPVTASSANAQSFTFEIPILREHEIFRLYGTR